MRIFYPKDPTDIQMFLDNNLLPFRIIVIL